MIGSIHISNLRNSEFIQFLKDILGAVKENDPVLLGVEQQYDQLLAIVDSMEVYFTMPKGSGITPELTKLNLRRNNSYMAIKSIIKGFTYSADATTKASAKLLENHLANLGAAILRDNYQSKTALIRIIVNDWYTNVGLAAALSELGLQAAVIELANANDLFNEQYLSRVIETASLPTGSLKTIRPAAKNAWYGLRDQLNAQYTIQNGSDPFGTTVNFINGFLENYNNLLARRAGGDDAPPGASVTKVA